MEMKNLLRFNNLEYIYYYKLSDGSLVYVDYSVTNLSSSLVEDILMNNMSRHIENIKKDDTVTHTLKVYDNVENTMVDVEIKYPTDTINYFHFFYGGDIINCQNYYIMRREEFIMLSKRNELKDFTDHQLWYFLNNMDLKGLLFFLDIRPVFVHDNQRNMTFISSKKLGEVFEMIIPKYCSHDDYSGNDHAITMNTSMGFTELEREQTVIFKPYHEYEGKDKTYHLDLVISPSVGNRFCKKTRADLNMCIEMKFSEFAEMLKNDSKQMMIQYVKE